MRSRPAEQLPACAQRRAASLAGRDRVAGGTWLALRPETPSVTMLLNRPGRRRRCRRTFTRPAGTGRGERFRSARGGARRKRRAATTGRARWCSPRPTRCWWLAFPAGRMGDRAGLARRSRMPRWTTANEPRARRGSSGAGAGRGHRHGVDARSSSRRYSGTTAATAAPAVCIHAGRMPTVSASLIALSARTRAPPARRGAAMRARCPWT